MASNNPKQELASHAAISAGILPPVTEPVIPITAGPVPSSSNAKLQWLLDINEQFFNWEFKQIVHIPLLMLSLIILILTEIAPFNLNSSYFIF